MKRERHGMRNSPEYRAWLNMRQRCNNPNHISYPNYGGRGISVCNEWENSFSAFFEHVGSRPEGMTLDRIDNSRGYEPGNVRWASYFDQNGNRRNSRANNTHCLKGHEITSENTYISSKGLPSCLKCRNNAYKKYKRSDLGKKRRSEYLETKANEAADRYVRNAYCILAT